MKSILWFHGGKHLFLPRKLILKVQDQNGLLFTHLRSGSLLYQASCSPRDFVSGSNSLVADKCVRSGTPSALSAPCSHHYIHLSRFQKAQLDFCPLISIPAPQVIQSKNYIIFFTLLEFMQTCFMRVLYSGVNN